MEKWYLFHWRTWKHQGKKSVGFGWKSGKLLTIVTKLILDPIFFKQTTENEVFNEKLLMYCSKLYAYHDSVYYTESASCYLLSGV